MATTAPIERRARVLHGDCLTVLAELDAASVDAVVTDPPYGLEFMGKEWDKLGAIIQPSTDTKWNGKGNPPFGGGGQRVRYGASAASAQAWHEDWARAVLRVLKPGGHLLAFGGTRTYHRLTCAIEDAGFEIRDCLMWIYGSGFPKSLDVSKAIDGVIGKQSTGFNCKGTVARSNGGDKHRSDHPEYQRYTGSTDAARHWQGWGTALKPAYEPIVLARKPLSGTVAATVQQYGTGAINVDGCRVPAQARPALVGLAIGYGADGHSKSVGTTDLGRWPANVLHDGSDEVVALFPQSGGGDLRGACNGRRAGGFVNVGSSNGSGEPNATVYPDSGSAARFFYTAKASRRERGEGNSHPTVKPLALMRYLCKLVTPPDGLILDPFAGSGSTGCAAVREGFRFVGIEQDDQSVGTAKKRTVETEFLPLERFLLDEGDDA